jgi:hypothetical protein
MLMTLMLTKRHMINHVHIIGAGVNSVGLIALRRAGCVPHLRFDLLTGDCCSSANNGPIRTILGSLERERLSVRGAPPARVHGGIDPRQFDRTPYKLVLVSAHLRMLITGFVTKRQIENQRDIYGIGGMFGLYK